MSQEQTSLKKPANVVIKPFEWQDWDTMWTIRGYQLAEEGVFLDGEIRMALDLIG